MKTASPLIGFDHGETQGPFPITARGILVVYDYNLKSRQWKIEH